LEEELLPAGHHLNLAGALSEAKPPEIDAKSDVSVGIILVHGWWFPVGKRYGESPLSGGIAALNPRLNTDDALSGNDFAPRGSVGEPPDAARAPFRTPLQLRGIFIGWSGCSGEHPYPWTNAL